MKGDKEKLPSEYKKSPKLVQKLRKFDSNGKIYFPKFIRQLFKGCRFYVLVEDGKIVLDPVKVDDDFRDDLEPRGDTE